MKLLKTERELSMHDFRAGDGHKKITVTLVGPHNESEGVVVEIGPAGAKQKKYIPLAKNKSLIETIHDNDELLPGAILIIEHLKDNSDGEGEFEVFFDDENSPKKEPEPAV